MTALRVNVVSIFYWPEVSGIGPYAAATAEYLAAKGDTVTAVVGVPHFPTWRRQDEACSRSIAYEKGVRIVRFNHYIPRRHNAVSRAVYEGSFFLSVAASKRLPRADVSVAVVPNLGSAFVVLCRRRKCGPFGAIVQDVSSLAAAQSGMAGGSAVSRVTSLIEGAAMRRAGFVGVVSAKFRAPLVEMGVVPERIVDTPNWTRIGPATCSRESIRQRFGWSSGTTVALHAGNMGSKQALETVIDSARQADEHGAAVTFVLMGDGNQRFLLREYGRGVRRLQFLESQPDALFSDVLRAADVLVLSERRSVRDMSLPSKLTSYFGVGRAIVAAVRGDGATAAEIARSGAGIVIPPEDPRALFRAVKDIGDDPAQGAALGRAGLLYAQSCLGADQTLQVLRRSIHALVGDAEGL